MELCSCLLQSLERHFSDDGVLQRGCCRRLHRCVGVFDIVLAQ